MCGWPGDSLLIGHHCGAHTVPYIEAKNSSAVFEHDDDATALVVNGFVKDVLQHLPMEFAVEAQKLISISLEGSVG
jgi:Fe-S cluster assembly protein SufB